MKKKAKRRTVVACKTPFSSSTLLALPAPIACESGSKFLLIGRGRGRTFEDLSEFGLELLLLLSSSSSMTSGDSDGGDDVRSFRVFFLDFLRSISSSDPWSTVLRFLSEGPGDPPKKEDH